MGLRMVVRSGCPTGPCSQTATLGGRPWWRTGTRSGRPGRAGSGREVVDRHGIGTSRIEVVAVPGGTAPLQLQAGGRAVGVVLLEGVPPVELEAGHQATQRRQVAGTPGYQVALGAGRGEQG